MLICRGLSVCLHIDPIPLCGRPPSRGGLWTWAQRLGAGSIRLSQTRKDSILDAPTPNPIHGYFSQAYSNCQLLVATLPAVVPGQITMFWIRWEQRAAYEDAEDPAVWWMCQNTAWGGIETTSFEVSNPETPNSLKPRP